MPTVAIKTHEVVSVREPKETAMDLKALFLDTDPLAMIALVGLLVTLLVTVGLGAFVIAKLPKRR